MRLIDNVLLRAPRDWEIVAVAHRTPGLEAFVAEHRLGDEVAADEPDRWQLLATAAPALSSAFVNEDFEFNQRTLQGTEKIQPRWKRCVRATDEQLGFLHPPANPPNPTTVATARRGNMSLAVVNRFADHH